MIFYIFIKNFTHTHVTQNYQNLITISVKKVYNKTVDYYCVFQQF